MTRTFALLILVWCVLSSAVARAAAPIQTTERSLSPYFFVENGDPRVDALPLEGTRVSVSISGMVAAVSVVQTYRNTGERPINARYVFPASTRAAVHGLRMKLGDKLVVAKIKEREQARREFEASRKAGKSATLLEQDRPNVFTMNLSNILPGDRVEVTLDYTELLVPTERIYEFVYPTVVGPRYSNQVESAARAPDRFVKTAYLKPGAPQVTSFELTGSLSTGVPIRSVQSPSHRLTQQQDSAKLVRFSLDTTERQADHRDFVLSYALSGDAIESGLSLYEAGAEKYFALVVEPPARVKADEVPPREYVFVVDVSGSMHGYPLNAAKRVLRELAAGLRSYDRFNVILFSGGSRLLAPKSVPATPTNLERALRVIDNEHGSGGTELLPALEQALALPIDQSFSRTFVVVTDGYIDADKRALDLVRENLGKANVFAFGIGSSVNRYLIEGLARAGYGEPFVVTSPDQAAAVASRFKQYIASPVLTNLSVEYDQFAAHDVFPKSIPDVLSERPVVIHGKWRGPSDGAITVRGTSGNAAFERRFDVRATPPRPENSALRYLWARTKIATLSDFAPDPSPAERASLVALGLNYNLLTRYTSFLAVSERVRNPGAPATDVEQPLPLAAGVSELAVSEGVHGAPEPELWLLLALTSLLLVGAYTARARRDGACLS